MWIRCIAWGSLVLFIQVLLFADTLNDFDDNPAFTASWAAVFSPSIVWLAVGFLYILSCFWRSCYFTAKAKEAKQNDTTIASSTDSTVRFAKRAARIALVDATFDLILFILFAVFIGLLVTALENKQVAAPALSFITISIPLIIAWSLLTIVAIIAALRTQGENRYQSTLNEKGCCAATFGGVLCCCEEDPDLLATANDARQDKKTTYVANAHYQQWPCAFMFSSSLTYGWPDLVLAIFIGLSLPIALLTTVLVAVFLDDSSPLFANPDPRTAKIYGAFIAPWILEGLIIIFCFIEIIWLCCCYNTHPPSGRPGFMHKYGELSIVFVVTAALATQQILLALRIDDNEVADWHWVFMPSYVLLTILFFVGCSFGWCCLPKTSTRSQKSRSNLYQEDDIDIMPLTSAWGICG